MRTLRLSIWSKRKGRKEKPQGTQSKADRDENEYALLTAGHPFHFPRLFCQLTLGWLTSRQLTNSGFAVTGNSVNSLNNGFLDDFCIEAGGAPGCIGMNTDGAGGQIATNTMFAPGTYTVSFDLAGEPVGFGGETDNIAVNFGDYSDSISLDAGAPFRTITFTATIMPFSQLDHRTDFFGGATVGQQHRRLAAR